MSDTERIKVLEIDLAHTVRLLEDVTKILQVVSANAVVQNERITSLETRLGMNS